MHFFAKACSIMHVLDALSHVLLCRRAQRHSNFSDVQELKDRIKNFDKDRGPILAAAQKRLAEAKAALEQAQAAFKAAEEEADVKALEQDRAADERGELAQQRQAAEAAQQSAQVRWSQLFLACMLVSFTHDATTLLSGAINASRVSQRSRTLLADAPHCQATQQSAQSKHYASRGFIALAMMHSHCAWLFLSM